MGKEKQDSPSPTGVLEDYLRSVDSDSPSSLSTNSDTEIQMDPRPSSRWRGFVEFFKGRPLTPLATLHPLSILKLSRRGSRSMREKPAFASMLFAHHDPCNFQSRWRNFTLLELQVATNYFSNENLIGKGGYAGVYMGCLQDGQLVAVKRLTKGTVEERIGDFLSELGIMAHVSHPNITKLIGYGVEGGMHLVLGFSPRGSLASLLQGPKEKIGWKIRYKVALGTAKGLLYLHEGCKRRIIHRDIKAANILITEDFEPQICDFGLAKWLPEHWTHHIISKFEGTFGYLAPEYLMHGIVDEKTDVFAFGVLLLELISGRRALDYLQQSLVLWAKPLIYKNKIGELIDPSLAGNYISKQMNLMLLASSLCIKQSSIRRPRMSQVVDILKGDLVCLESMRVQRLPLFKRVSREELSESEGHNLSKDFMNLHGHR